MKAQVLTKDGLEQYHELNKQYISNEISSAASEHVHDDRYYTEPEIDTKLDAKLNTSLKGATNGLAELDANGKVITAQLPSYVDDVLDYTAKANFPTTGETGKIYIDTTTNKTYRWSGSAYVEISASLALGETSSTAYRGDRGKVAYEHSQQTSGNPHGVTKSDVGLSDVDNTSDIDKPISTATQIALTDMQQQLQSLLLSLQTIDISSSFFDPNDTHENVTFLEWKASKSLHHIAFYVRLETLVDLNSSKSLFKVNPDYKPFNNNNIYYFNNGDSPFSTITINSVWNSGTSFNNWGGILPAGKYYIAGSYLCV